MLAVEADYAAKEAGLQAELDNFESLHPGYDEYRYDLDPIGHNPHELAAYLSALLHEYTPQSAAAQLQHIFDLQYVLRQHRTIAEASAVESPIRQETIGFPAHFFARAHNFKPPGRACQPEADSPMRT